MNPPLPNTYWVIPGRFLAGEHPSGRDESETRERLARFAESGIDHFVDLTEIGEMPDYRPLLPAGAQYLRNAIVDTCVPEDASQTVALLAGMKESLTGGRILYVHCRAGIGRTAVIVGCFLVEEGLRARAALKQLNRLWRQSERAKTWPKVPQTSRQSDYILNWPKLRQSAD